MLDPTKKDTPHPRAMEKPQQDGGGAKSHLESNPIPTRDDQRAQTKPFVQQETSQRLSQTYLLVSPVEEQVSSGLPQGQGLWVQQNWVWPS